MKGLLKRVSLLILSGAVLSLILSCGSKERGSTAVAASAGGEVTKPASIKMIVDTVMLIPEDGQQQLADKYEELTGVKLEIVQPPHQEYTRKVQLAFSSGDIPDVVQMAEQDYVSFALQGAFVDMDPYYQASEVLKSIPAEYIDSNRVGGKLYGFSNEVGGGVVTYIRQDWLDKLGLGVPSTWEELVAVMEAFTTGDPDGNGLNDTVGYTMPGIRANNYARDFYQDANPEVYLKDGVWVDGALEPEMKPALERLAYAYQNGLLDQEVFTNKTSTCREKFYSSKAGIFAYWAGNWNIKLDDMVQQRNENLDTVVVPIPAIKGSYYSRRVPSNLSITIKAENPAGIFKYLIEYMHDGGEGQMLFTHGVEGVHYAVENGEYKTLPRISDPKNLFIKAFISPELQLNPWTDPFSVDGRITNSIAVMNGSAVDSTLVPPSPTLAQINADLQVLKDNLIAKVMNGEKQIDQALAEYKAATDKIGLPQALAEMNG